MQLVKRLIISYIRRGISHNKSFTICEMRIDHLVCLHLLIEEHLVSCSEVSLLEVAKSGSVPNEKVIWHTTLKVRYINYTLLTQLVVKLFIPVWFSNSFCSFSAYIKSAFYFSPSPYQEVFCCLGSELIRIHSVAEVEPCLLLSHGSTVVFL